MNNALSVQYVGFEAKPKMREYTFRVKEGGDEPREFKLTIPNEAFLSHRARYQDAPDICAHCLQRELDTSTNHPEKSHWAISDVELEEYRVAHSTRSLYGRAPKAARNQ
jgi:hypothetical protein